MADFFQYASALLLFCSMLGLTSAYKGIFPARRGRARGRALQVSAQKEEESGSAAHALVGLAKDALGLAFKNRETPYAYFYALETIARVPYFSMTSVLHLLETLGLSRRKELLLLHFSESWNEMHHLLIMEDLGGDALFRDRFVAQHLAFGYYWIVVALYLASPPAAYLFNHEVEKHAAETYSNFLAEKEAELRALPVPEVAALYYSSPTQPLVSAAACDNGPRQLSSLYDVFCCIRDDELGHAQTMISLAKKEQD